MEREQEEKKEAELSAAAFRRQLALLKEKCASLDVEIEQHRAILQNLQRGEFCPALYSCTFRSNAVATERNRERSLLNSHAGQISPELAECEQRLQCIIEGIDKDRVLIRFTHVDRTDTSREFSVVFDVSERAYRGQFL